MEKTTTSISLEDRVIAGGFNVMRHVMPVMSGIAAGMFVGGVGEYAVPVWAYVTGKQVKDDINELKSGTRTLPVAWQIATIIASISTGPEIVHNVRDYWTRGKNAVHTIGYYATSGTIVSARMYHLGSNVVHAIQGKEPFDYSNITIIMTNAAAAVHMTFRHSPRYQAMLHHAGQIIKRGVKSIFDYLTPQPTRGV